MRATGRRSSIVSGAVDSHSVVACATSTCETSWSVMSTFWKWQHKSRLTIRLRHVRPHDEREVAAVGRMLAVRLDGARPGRRAAPVASATTPGQWAAQRAPSRRARAAHQPRARAPPQPLRLRLVGACLLVTTTDTEHVCKVENEKWGLFRHSCSRSTPPRRLSHVPSTWAAACARASTGVCANQPPRACKNVTRF